MLGGRVKTLHPKIHGGLLADRRNPEHVRAAARSTGSSRSTWWSVNLYPFRETVASGAGVRRRDREDRHRRPGDGARGGEELRVGRRGRRSRAVRRRSLDELAARGRADARDPPRARGRRVRAHGRLRRRRRRLVRASRTATPTSLPSFVGLAYEKVGDLRYGENPHQRGALYREAAAAGRRSAARASCRARRCRSTTGSTPTRPTSWSRALPEGAAVIVKHNNPCGAAARGLAGRVVPRRVRVRHGERVRRDRGVPRRGATPTPPRAMADVFTEVVVAPSFTAARERGVRRAAEPPRGRGAAPDRRRARRAAAPGRRARAGPRPASTETRADWKVVSSREPTAAEWDDLALAWTIAWRVKSNTIVFVKDGATVGVGAGQMSRVDASWIATRKAGERARGRRVSRPTRSSRSPTRSRWPPTPGAPP